MKIMFREANFKKIGDELKKENGGVLTHTFNWAEELREHVKQFEKKLFELGLTKKMAVGAKMTIQSSEKMPNAYKYRRIINEVELEYCSTGIAFIGVTRFKAFTNQGGSNRIYLKQKQHNYIVENLSKKYHVIAEKNLIDNASQMMHN